MLSASRAARYIGVTRAARLATVRPAGASASACRGVWWKRWRGRSRAAQSSVARYAGKNAHAVAHARRGTLRSARYTES